MNNQNCKRENDKKSNSPRKRRGGARSNSENDQSPPKKFENNAGITVVINNNDLSCNNSSSSVEDSLFKSTQSLNIAEENSNSSSEEFQEASSSIKPNFPIDTGDVVSKISSEAKNECQNHKFDTKNEKNNVILLDDNLLFNHHNAESVGECSAPKTNAENGINTNLDESNEEHVNSAVSENRETSPSSRAASSRPPLESLPSADDGTDEEESWDNIVDNRHRLPGVVNWRIVESLRKREHGCPSNQYTDWFRFRASGSLHFLQRLELMTKLQAHDGCVNCLNFSYDGSRLASGSDDLKVCIWDWANRQKPLLEFNSGHRANVFQAKFMPLTGDCVMVTCARDGQVRLAELSVTNVCKGTRKLAQHRGSAHKLSTSKDSPHVLRTCGEDGVVFEIDLREPTPNKLLTVKEPANKNDMIPLYSIDTDPSNSAYFAVSGQDNFCRIFDRRFLNGASAQPVKKLSPSYLIKSDNNDPRTFHKANVTCLVYNFDGTELLASYNDDDILLFDTKCTSDNPDQAILKRYTGHRNNATVKGVNFFGPNSEFVVSGSDCGNIYFWDKKSQEIVQFMSGDESGVVNVLEPHPHSPILATSGLDNDVKIWVPSNENPKFDRKVLRKLTKTNTRRRNLDRTDLDTNFDARMLLMMIARIRRSRRQRRRGRQGNPATGADGGGESSQQDVGNNGQNEDSDDASDISDNDEILSEDDDVIEENVDDAHSDDNIDDDAPALQCRPS